MRYLSHTDEDINKMLGVIGKEGLMELFDSIPKDLILKKDLKLPEVLSEWELEEYLSSISSNHIINKSYIGAGSYNHYIPNIISYLTSRSEFLTSYTPYQPEISQGTLQALFEFQTYISTFLDMDYANASMYDGATSFVEGILLSARVTKRHKVVVSKAINPNYLEVLETYCEATDIEIIYLECGEDGKTDLSSIPILDDIAAIGIQSPNYYGVIEDLDLVKPIIGNNKTLFITVFTEILSYGLFNPPGFYGADLACGEGQSFGIAQGFGGPSLGVFAFKEKYLRSVPGRLVGQSIDKNGDRSFCLTLSTREQHIRRDKATSNICSNQGLCTLSATIYLSLLGGDGLKKLALQNYNNTEYLKNGLIKKGCKSIFSGATFNEFLISFPKGFNENSFIKNSILPGVKIKNNYLITVTEVFSKEDLDKYIELIGEVYDL